MLAEGKKTKVERSETTDQPHEWSIAERTEPRREVNRREQNNGYVAPTCQHDHFRAMSLGASIADQNNAESHWNHAIRRMVRAGGGCPLGWRSVLIVSITNHTSVWGPVTLWQTYSKSCISHVPSRHVINILISLAHSIAAILHLIPIDLSVSLWSISILDSLHSSPYIQLSLLFNIQYLMLAFTSCLSCYFLVMIGACYQWSSQGISVFWFLWLKIFISDWYHCPLP